MNPLPVAVALALLALPASAQFDAETPVRVTGISTGSTLNVRAGPGTGNTVVTTLSGDDAELTILECTAAADWCRLGVAGDPLGWVAARYLAAIDTAAPAPDAEPRFSESARLARVTGIDAPAGETVTVPELPPYLLGAWDDDRAACADDASASRVTVLRNGLRIGAATARFKNAIFRGEGYDLTTLLMQERDVMNTVPQRALYRLEPGEDTLAVSGDVLTVRRLTRCATP